MPLVLVLHKTAYKRSILNVEVAYRNNLAGTLRQAECNTVEPRYIQLGYTTLKFSKAAT